MPLGSTPGAAVPGLLVPGLPLISGASGQPGTVTLSNRLAGSVTVSNST